MMKKKMKKKKKEKIYAFDKNDYLVEVNQPDSIVKIQ